MKKSFFILLGLWSLCACALDGYAVKGGTGRQRLESGVEYEIVLPRPEDIALEEYLRAADNAAVRLFRVARGSSTRPCLLRFDAEVPAGEVRLESTRDAATFTFHNDLEQWRDNRAVNRLLVAAILLSSHGLNPADPAIRLPNWIAAGMAAEVEARLTEDRIFRVGYFPGVRSAILRGAAPDWAVRYIEDPEMEDAPGPLWDLYAESSRLMLDIASRLSSPRDNALADYLVLKSRGGKNAKEIFYSTVGRVARNRDRSLDLGDEEATARGLESFAYSRLFTKYQPLPGAVTRDRFRQWRQVSCLAMKESGDLEKLEGDIVDLADWVRLYPEARLTPSQKIKELNALHAYASLSLNPEFEQLVRLLSALRSTGDAPTKVDLGIAADAFEAACERQRRLEQMLVTGRGAPGVIPSRDPIRWTVAAARLPEIELPPGIAAFLKQAAEAYLGR